MREECGRGKRCLQRSVSLLPLGSGGRKFCDAFKSHLKSTNLGSPKLSF